jgi:biopolymer transport protein ExbB/TolQ
MTLPLLPVADFLYAYRVSGFLSGKLIIYILLAASVVAWTVMVTKWIELKQAQLETRRFLQAFRHEKHPLGLFLRRQKFPDSPLFRIYESACQTLGIELEARGEDGELFHSGLEGKTSLNLMQLGAVRNATERQIADQQLTIESRMGFLSTAVSASPLLGLLGTVWGVLDSFSQMALQGVANLSAVAPGIASALLTTVVGLLVAIPSSIGYNILISKIRTMAVQMDNYADEFMAQLQRTFIRD